MSLPQRASIYDRLRPHLDAADLIRRLGIEQTRESGSEAYCRPLCHESTSGESLQINLQSGRWNCKACQSYGVRGDLVQLVEYVLTGGQPPTQGAAQNNSASHREALNWLCDQFGISFDESRVGGDVGLDVVHAFAMAAHEYLLDSPTMLEWILDKWGFDLETVEAYGLGFMPSPLPPKIYNEAHNAQSRAAFRASGLGYYDPQQKWHTGFEGRVTFPYLEHGRAVYLIGRATNQTPPAQEGRLASKYYKLLVHSEKRRYISERITNNHLYNEQQMRGADSVVVAEGVADGVALSSLGICVVSPVTISFNEADLKRFLEKAHKFGVKRVDILFDNELSGSGNWAARRVGVQLVKGGIETRILTLPLLEPQLRAREEVKASLGEDLFAELELTEPRLRKKLIATNVLDPAAREWVLKQIEESKIDAAEWTRVVGAGAAGRFDQIRRKGVDVVELEVQEKARTLDADDSPTLRANHFREEVALIAHIDDRLSREGLAAVVAKAAGRGVTKAEIVKRIADVRREIVKDRRVDKAEDDRIDHDALRSELVVIPPEGPQARQSAPPPPTDPTKPAAPPPPGKAQQVFKNDHERFAAARAAVAKNVEGRVPEEDVGMYVATTITHSMGFTPFQTPEELYLVRGSSRVDVGRGSSRRFASLLYLASGLSPAKSQHRGYIAAVLYFLERDARKAQDVSWSYVDPVSSAVFFPLGDRLGRIVKIEPGSVTRVKMADVRVPAVAGEEFEPLELGAHEGGIASALSAFRWTSLNSNDRLVLMYWLVCLPVLRRVGTVPIVRIEGGSSSGKTRTVDAVSFLVNGRKSSSVPTAAALVSRLSREMLTIDDNRETKDVSDQFLGTLLQATNLGAREKRKANSDTGTVVERVCGALMMNGIEPIHDGRAELASRMLTMRCHAENRAADSPRSDAALANEILRVRDAFWSEAIQRCSRALELEQVHGENVAGMIERVFGSTRIGRLSAYLRLMYLAWVAGQPDTAPLLAELSPIWVDAFGRLAGDAMESLVNEELTVTVMRYVFAYAEWIAEAEKGTPSIVRAFDDRFLYDRERGDQYLGPMRASRLARLARTAGRELNAPRSVAVDLRAGQLERRLLDGRDYLEAAGIDVELEQTVAGRVLFTFRRMRPPVSVDDLDGAETESDWPVPG
jgi:hypothetical protein